MSLLASAADLTAVGAIATRPAHCYLRLRFDLLILQAELRAKRLAFVLATRSWGASLVSSLSGVLDHLHAKHPAVLPTR